MTNSYHLVITTLERSPARGMSDLNGGYPERSAVATPAPGTCSSAAEAILLERDGRLLELCRHMAPNPVRTGLVGRADGWP